MRPNLRYRARIELSSRPTGEVVAATQKWLESLDPDDMGKYKM